MQIFYYRSMDKRGRATEYWGADYLASDKQVLLYDLPAKAKDIYKKQTAEYKNYIDAFVKGINDYANDHPEAIDKEMKVVLPVNGEDVFAISKESFTVF